MTNGGPGLALVGAGSLGQVFSALLAASGQAVTLLATPGSAARLLGAGRIRLTGVVDLEAPAAPAPAPAGTVGITDDAGRLPAGAGLLFATKGHQLPAAVAAVRAAWPGAGDETAWVGGLQNGLVKDDLLAAAFGQGRVVGAVTIVGGQRDSDGAIVMTSRGATYLGEFPHGGSPRVAAATAALTAAGLPTEATEAIQSVLWSKEANAVGVFGVSVLSRLAAPRMMRRPDLVRAYLALIREVDEIARAYDIGMGDYTNFPIKTYLGRTDAENVDAFTSRPFIPGAPGSREIYPSMTQDLLAGRAMEVDQIFTDLLERAERARIPAPRIALVRDLIRGIDPGRYDE